MVSQHPKAINRWEQRSRRARFLADSYPACREILAFYSGVAKWQGNVATGLTAFHRIPDVVPSLLDHVEHTGSPLLARAAQDLRRNPGEIVRVIREYWDSPGHVSATDFFARVVLQVYAGNLPEGLGCPWCARAPQAGCLKEQGDGRALDLVCAMCLRRRGFPRTRCPACNESSEAKQASFTSDAYPHVRLQACETCRSYLHVIDQTRDPAAIPEVDELAALPLDLWATERGYRKLQPNLAGV